MFLIRAELRPCHVSAWCSSAGAAAVCLCVCGIVELVRTCVDDVLRTFPKWSPQSLKRRQCLAHCMGFCSERGSCKCTEPRANNAGFMRAAAAVTSSAPAWLICSVILWSWARDCVLAHLGPPKQTRNLEWFRELNIAIWDKYAYRRRIMSARVWCSVLIDRVWLCRSDAVLFLGWV